MYCFHFGSSLWVESDRSKLSEWTRSEESWRNRGWDRGGMKWRKANVLFKVTLPGLSWAEPMWRNTGNVNGWRNGRTKRTVEEGVIQTLRLWLVELVKNVFHSWPGIAECHLCKQLARTLQWNDLNQYWKKTYYPDSRSCDNSSVILRLEFINITLNHRKGNMAFIDNNFLTAVVHVMTVTELSLLSSILEIYRQFYILPLCNITWLLIGWQTQGIMESTVSIWENP